MEINPHYINAWVHYGELKAKKNDFTGARECFQKAADSDPFDIGLRLRTIFPLP